MYIYILYSIYIQSLQQGGYNFWRVFSEMGGFEAGALFTFIKKVVFAFLTCFLALGGSIVGTITGAVKGQTTETGMVRGALVGSVTGAITALQLMELMVNGEPFSKVALLSSLVNGKVFMEWASPAVQKAYQYQISAMETNFEEISDIFEVTTIKGLSQDSINMLPKWKFGSTKTNGPCHEMVTCTICLQDFKNGEIGRMLPICRHSFHLQCIDEWLSRHGSCPMCRKDVIINGEDDRYQQFKYIALCN